MSFRRCRLRRYYRGVLAKLAENFIRRIMNNGNSGIWNMLQNFPLRGLAKWFSIYELSG